MNMEHSEEACCTLVETRPEFRELYNGNTYFVTISPNPRTKLKVKLAGKQRKIPYDKLPQRIQLEYCMKHLRVNYLQLCNNPILIGSVEHNKSGNVHLHFLINSPDFKSNTYLDIYRRDILFTEISAENLPNKGKKTDFMNNIVECFNIDETLKYLDKDYTKNVLTGIYKNYLFI